MLKLTYLNAKSKGITGLIGLETALNLATLNLSENNISDLSPLSGLLKLGSLNLYLNKIADISPLSGLTNLYYLSVNTNKISDISPVAGLVNLTTLSMSYNPITEFISLTGHTKFRQIYATGTAALTKETYLNHIPMIWKNNPKLTIFRYDPGCQTSRSTDVNQDCQVNLLDLAMIASDWLTCNHIYEEMCP
jgi:Leucine-rich repeat (LRR) protein